MFIAILFFALSIVFGICIMRKIGFAPDPITWVVFGIPVGIAFSTFIMLALYALNGYLGDPVFGLGLILIVAPTILLLYLKPDPATKPNRKKAHVGKNPRMPDKATIGALTVYAIIAFVVITSTQMQGGSLYCVGPAICSDLIYHLGIGNSLLYTHFPPAYLFTIKTINVFPFILDFYSAILMKYGFSLQLAMLLPYLVLFFSAVMGTKLLIYKVTRNPVATIAALFIFWFGSDYFMAIAIYSLNGVASFIPNVFPPISYLLGPYGMSSAGPSAILNTAQFITSGWTSIIYGMLLPQRDFVLGLPLGIMIIYAIYLLGFEGARFSKKELLFLGAAIGTLPLIHPITLEVIAAFGLFTFAYLISSRKNAKRTAYEFILVLVPLLCLALPQLAYMTQQKIAEGWYSFIYQNFVYSSGNAAVSLLYSILNVIVYWFEMIGVPLIVAVFGFKLAPKKVRILFIPFFLLWVFITIYSVQPVPADSNKIFLYIFLVLSAIAGYPLAWLYSKRKFLGKISAIAVLAAICLNFPLLYLHWALGPNLWITATEFNASEFITKNTPQNAIFAVNDNQSLTQVVPSLSHRETILSIEPYVSIDEHTYPMQQLDYINRQVFQYGNCSVIRTYNISYVYYMGAHTGQSVFDNGNFILVYNATDRPWNKDIAIYKTNCV